MRTLESEQSRRERPTAKRVAEHDAEADAIIAEVKAVIEIAGRDAVRQVKITTPCPSCGWESLFIGTGGHITCSVLECKDPSVAP